MSTKNQIQTPQTKNIPQNQNDDINDDIVAGYE